MSTKKGIDVSKYQTNVDFKKVKAAGYDFVIIRAGYGKQISQKDKQFETHYKNAKAAGLGVGAYWYSYAQSEADAKAEAATCIEAIKGKKFEYPIYFDLEEQSAFAKGKSVCCALVTAFCTALENAGYFAGLYISRSPLTTYISSDVATKYALWVAEYATKCGYSGSYGMWQYSSTGKVDGISGNVDMDYAYEDYPTIIKSGGYNGYEKSSEKKALESDGFKKNDKGAGVYAYKRWLMAAQKKGLISQTVQDNDLFGAYTVTATNQALKYFGYKETGVGGEKLIKMIAEKIVG